MQLQHIKLENLKTASVNVRKVGGKDIADLEPSIRSLGLLQPLLVRPNCEGFEIIAGQRRYHALSKIAEDTTVEPVLCLIMEKGDDAKAVEASLAENIARLPMDEVDQYKAFAELVRKGQGVDDIALQFGVTTRLVKQRLAIANLLSPILTLYRKEEIGADTVRILTLATKKQQKAWLELYRSDEDYAPEGYRLKQWLFGGAQIPTSNALFDLEAYEDNVISDLFGEESYFDNPERFWEARNVAIAEAKTRYLTEGWSDVIVLDVGEYFPAYDYVDTAKDDGGKVYVRIAEDGEVTFYEGQLSRKDIKARDKANDTPDTDVAPQKPELTKAMQNYLDLHRHSATRTKLLSHQGVALRLAVAQIIAGSDLWAVKADPQKAANESIAESLTANTAETLFSEERLAVMALLELTNDNDETIVPRKDDWQVTRDVHAIFAKLTALADEDVTRILTFVVAETLPSGSAMVEGLGSKLDVEMGDHWSPDQTFFDLFRDKQAINGMLKEVGGKATADAHIASTAKVQKKIIQDYLDGTRKGGKKDWHPRYMAFPMATYTKRGGISAVENGKTVKAHYVS
ncbi:ParB/RepB/Spo0J family partition protein [Sulfitobacter mediterraneus]|uniref:ParB/RepB/Spo0J family partition protein n=1 Tax=Sulfitobacter mediterraneus TaxID=83219 RepID=UPI00193A0DF8|nr:ParB/RepB/Spo0J family partition protein [Sulfitobacter mediterraneus]MBM1556229.1 ParB/RepB/Spo0J family partition protein [Sulfitobacter mediterraneus]MBM1567733.1 ParB/RepB/Spo0J family partition protein [Sulfitobacter mediterraneus]MBM1571583.1 ParB/RepB/Spo0J family partition protein [Sulfitobacter mediterraneus]MBM1575371.1 ParB/RepB/Spo0J family partition protein [Sulfitobacter mediterraneus]MBM1579138.1 ParB/RepB/Spo0J family partition protein [Sulfitobacter mediterraneus]